MDFSFGPRIGKAGTEFRLWAPSAGPVELVIDGRPPVGMVLGDDGFHRLEVADAGPGTRYKFRVKGQLVPDPASRQQDGGTAGWSVVRAPIPFERHKEPLRPWHETTICEVHIGTVTPEGTFTALKERLEHFRDAGYTALEIMPINAFPGQRGWGYDGTLIFAPLEAYGTPAELRALVNRAHELGLCLILDVVYNHFGQVDNFIEDYAPEFFDESVDTPWGKGIDFTRPEVRQFYYENACMWLTEFDFDGLRFDSIHEMKTEGREQFLTELAETARQEMPAAKLIVEDMENLARWLERDHKNRPKTYSAQWDDDIHHVLHFLVTGEAKQGYDEPGTDAIADLEKALADGFVHDGEADGDSNGNSRGEPASRLPPDCFISYLQNHDQIGNRADGMRLPDRVGPDKLDFLHTVMAMAPQVPLYFMGEEANLCTPFPFFVDLSEKDAEVVRQDRYKQMRESFEEEVEDGELPNPNAEATFLSAKLDWSEFAEEDSRASLERFRHLMDCRRRLVWPLAATKARGSRSWRKASGIVVEWEFKAGTLVMALNPSDLPQMMDVVIDGESISRGDVEQEGESLRLGPWAVACWVRGQGEGESV